MNLWQSLTGLVRVSVTSAELEKSLEGLSSMGIHLYQLERTDLLTGTFWIRRPDLRQAAAFCEKQGSVLKQTGKQGLFWYFPVMLHRPVLLTGMAMLLLLALLLPTRVFFFRVEGNAILPDNRILEAAESCGIRFGVSRRSIRSEKMKNALLGALPELQWAGINTYGCLGVISVKERQQTRIPEAAPEISGIVALRDGIITDCTVTRGNGVCAVGQPVKQGQLLISPYVDCGLSIKTVVPEGEIFAETNRKLRAVLPDTHTDVRSTGPVQRRYSLILGKKRINFRKGSGISDTTCGRMYEEYYITLPGGFHLPVRLAVETILYRTGSAGELSQADAERMLTSFSPDYISAQMIAGTILEDTQTIARENGFWLLEGSFVCNEMIGRTGAERNGEWND